MARGRTRTRRAPVGGEVVPVMGRPDPMAIMLPD